MVLPTRVSRQPSGSAGSRFRKDTSRIVSPSMPLTFFRRNPNSESISSWPTTGASWYAPKPSPSLMSVAPRCRPRWPPPPRRSWRLTTNHRRPKSMAQAMIRPRRERSTTIRPGGLCIPRPLGHPLASHRILGTITHASLGHQTSSLLLPGVGVTYQSNRIG
ncbi:hypothetical protein BGW80DRAFT_582789 [Lactifluus volemus]|nr:hypothetical protein BGW80DRAFT_582789 [Lactifluus volemus]